MFAFFLRILKVVLDLIEEIIKNNDTKCRIISTIYEYYRKTNFTIKYNKNSKIVGEISNAKSLI